MELKITSQIEAKKIVNSRSKYWNVISISSSDDGWPKLQQARDLVKLNFHDIGDSKIKHYNLEEDILAGRIILPSAEEIHKGLEFGRRYLDGPLLVHCHAGISRSAAMAWLILYDKFRDAKFSTYFMYKTRSMAFPNQRVMRIGLKILEPNKEKRLEVWNEILTDPIWISNHETIVR